VCISASIIGTRNAWESATVKKPLIIQYTNLLHEHRDPEAGAVKAFMKSHSADKVFVRRAKVLNRVFKLKEHMVTDQGGALL